MGGKRKSDSVMSDNSGQFPAFLLPCVNFLRGSCHVSAHSISFLTPKKKKVTNYASTNWQCVITKGRWHFLSLSLKKQSDSASGVLIRAQFTSMKIESIVSSLYI